MRRHKRRTLLFGAIYLRRDQHAVPMHQFRRIGIVDHVHSHRLAFAHPQHGSRRSPVVANGRKNVRAVELHRHRSNAQRVICFASSASSRRHRHAWASVDLRQGRHRPAAGLRQAPIRRIGEDRVYSRSPRRNRLPASSHGQTSRQQAAPAQNSPATIRCTISSTNRDKLVRLSAKRFSRRGGPP